MTDEPSNWELMRVIQSLDGKIDELCNCLWGPNRDNGIVTATARNADRICRIERIVYGVIGAVGTVVIGACIALIQGVI